METTGLDPRQLLVCVIQPVHGALGLPGGKNADALSLGICAQESNFRFLMQTLTGPARGLWQMEPATHADLWKSYLAYQDALAKRVTNFVAEDPSSIAQLATNLAYACACARVQLYRAPEALPSYTDVPGMAAYWKKAWNTPQGAGKPEQFIANWNRFALSSVIGA